MDKNKLIAALKQIKTLAEGALKSGAAKSGRLPKSKNEETKPKRTSPAIHTGSLSFSLNSRAFMKKYGKGMSGSEKFVLLVAHIAKGKPGREISSDQLSSEWNRMKSVLGGAFNQAHATRAKERGWINSPKRGSYVLSNTWKEALGAD